MYITDVIHSKKFSIGAALTLCFLAVLFNYLSIVVSSVLYGDTGPAAFAPANLLGSNIVFFGLPYALSLLYIGLSAWLLQRYFPAHLGTASYIHHWGTVFLAALASYALLSLPLLVQSQGALGLGMTVIGFIRSSLLM